MRSFKRRDRGAQGTGEEARVVFDSAKRREDSQEGRQVELCKKITPLFSKYDLSTRENSLSSKKLDKDTVILNEREMLVKLALLRSGIPSYYEPYEFASGDNVCAFYPDFITSLFIDGKPVVIERHTSPIFPDVEVKNLAGINRGYLDYVKKIGSISKDYGFHLVLISQISREEMNKRLGEDIANYVDDYWYVKDCLKHRVCFEFEVSGNVNQKLVVNSLRDGIRDACLIDSELVEHPRNNVPKNEIEIVVKHEGNVRTYGLVYVHTSFPADDLSFLSCAVENISSLSIKDESGETSSRTIVFRTVNVENDIERVRKSRQEEEDTLTNLIEKLKARGHIDRKQLIESFLMFDDKNSDKVNKRPKSGFHLARRELEHEYPEITPLDEIIDEHYDSTLGLSQDIEDKKLKKSTAVVNSREQSIKNGILKYGIPAYYEPYQFKGERTRRIYPPDFLTGLFIDGKQVAIERHSSPRDSGDWVSFRKYLEKLDDVRKTYGFHMVLIGQTPKGNINRMTGVDVSNYVDEYWFVNDPYESKLRHNRHTRHDGGKRRCNKVGIDHIYDSSRERDRIEKRLRSLLERGIIDGKLLDIKLAKAIEKSKSIGKEKKETAITDLEKMEGLKLELRDRKP